MGDMFSPDQWSQGIAATKAGGRMNSVGALDPLLERMGLPTTGRNQAFASMKDSQERGGPLYTPGRLPSISEMFDFYLDFLKTRMGGVNFPGNAFPGLQSARPPVMPSDFDMPLGDRGL